MRPRPDPTLPARIALPAGRPVTLAAWTPHVELEGVVLPPSATQVPLTLSFEHAGTLQATATIVRPVQKARQAAGKG